MIFLAPGWLLLSLLVVPVLVLHARRQKTVVVGSLRIWRTLRAASAPRPHWRSPPPSLLLFLQIAIILSLALALAQPRLAGPDVPDHTIFVLDRSASMRAQDVAPDRFAAARDRLEIELPSALRSGLVSIVSVDADPDMVAARQSRLPAVLPRLYDLVPTDEAPDWQATADWIDTVTMQGERTLVRLLTDDQGSLELSESDDRRIAETIFGNRDIANAALTANVVPVPEVPGLWRLSGTVTTSSADLTPAELTVRFARPGLEGELDWARIPLDWEEGELVASFIADLEFPGPGRLTLSLPDDQGPADNTQYFTLTGAGPLSRVLIIGEEQPELVRALEAAGAGIVSRAASLPDNDAAFDLVIINGALVPRKPATNVLWLGPARISGAPAPGPLTTLELSGWSSGHPLSEGLQWERLPAQPVYPSAPMSGTTIVAEAGGYPLLQARTSPEGREVFLSIDLEASPLKSGPALPVLIANLVGWIGGEQSCHAGARCLLPAHFLAATVTAPDGTSQTLGLSGPAGFAEQEFVPHRAGFHRLERGERVIDVAVNPSAGQTANLSAGSAVSSSAPAGPLDLWWWLAALAALLLVVEGIVAGRGAELFLVPARLRRDSPGASRRRWALGLRLASLSLVGLALLSVPVPLRETANAMVALLDPPPDGSADLSRLAEAGLNSSGAISADPDAPMRLGQPPARTNLTRALALAQAMLPADRDGRVVLASDGNQTSDDLARAIASLSAPLDLYPLLSMPSGEIILESVSVPVRAAPGQTLPGKAEIFSNGGGIAHLSILQNGLPVRSEEITLRSGSNSVGFELPIRASGTILVEAIVQSDADTFEQNNRNGVLIEIAEPAPVLLVAPDAEEGQLFARALRVQDIGSTVVAPNAAPRTLADWLDYPLVVLLNTPALALTRDQQTQLAQAVEQHGRGLLMLGGDNAFGAGGYYETPLEEISPLSSRVPHEAPQAALAFVLDRSGSMAGQVGSVTRLDIAKGAITRAIELMTPDSLVGIVAFDEMAQNVLPLTLRGAEGLLDDAIADITPGGGTRLSPGLLSAIEQLEQVEANVKHAIVVTDGLIEPLDFSHILERARAAEITVSTVAVGTSAITDRLETIAELGDGTYYATREFEALPSILAQDIMTLGEPLVREESATVVLSGDRPDFLAQMSANVPPLTSYVRTSLKPQAGLHMAVKQGDEEIPILASWRYGSGRVMAFAAHGAGSSTRDWMEMSGFPLIWAQAVRHFLPDVLGPGLHLSLHRAGDDVVVTADLIGIEGEPIGAQTVTATLESDLASAVLSEVAPGRYRGVFELPHIGEYAISASVGAITQTARIHIPYPARYDFTRADPDRLARIAQLTGGRILADVDDVLRPQSRWSWAPASWVWLLAAFAAFGTELVLRKGWLWLPLLGRAGENGR